MKKILVVDDDTELRANLSEILREAGYHISEAASGKEAIEKAKTEEFDIALLDLMMPRMSGTDTLLELKKMNPKTKAIMITAFATVENAVEAIKRGASDYISKPFKIETLLSTIKRVLEEARFEEGAKGMDFDFTLSSLSSPVRRKIIRLLNLKTSVRFAEMARELGIEEEHTKLAFHLKILREAGVIEQDPEKSYSLTNEGMRIVNCLKILENYIVP